MISFSPSVIKKSFVPKVISEKVLTVGYRHQPYEGGIGHVLYVYEKYFQSFKYVTSHRMLPNKIHLIAYFLGQYIKLVKVLSRDKVIRIVHMHSASYGCFYRNFIVFLTTKYVYRRQTIYHMHGSEFKLFYEESNAVLRQLIRFMIENTDVMICLSDSWKTYFTTRFQMKRIEVLRNVIDLPHRSNNVQSKLSTGPLQVLFLGLIGDRKGLFDLLDTILQHKIYLEGRLRLIIGGNGEVERLTQYIAQHNLSSIVRFEGWVSGSHKDQLLTESDVYILPSYNEGLPLSILEAMSYQLPVISTPVGGTPEVVKDGINGFLVTPGDTDALYNRLMQFVNQPDLSTTMGEASGSIVNQYLPEAIFPKLLTLYNSLLAKPV